MHSRNVSGRLADPLICCVLAAAALCGAACAGPAGSPATSPPLGTPATRTAPGPAGPIAPPEFARLEGVYRQGARAFVVTYQGWWLDLDTGQLRQLLPLGGATFGYGPGWQVGSPVRGRLHFAVSTTGSGVEVTGRAPGGATVRAGRMRTTARNVRFRSTGARLAGTLTLPPGPGPHPAVVILQGSGPLDRHFESISQGIYLSMGFAVLAFDKRGTGSSTGAFPGELATTASIGIQADDAVAAARFLMAQPGIDHRQVGFDANSQGGWVAPLAAERLPRLAFAILIASPAVSTAQQDMYASFSGGSAFVPAKSPGAIDAAVRATTGGYDPRPALAALRVPAIWVYGQLDRQVPVRVCVQVLTSFRRPQWTVDVLPGGSHGLIATRHGLDSEVPGATGFAGGYLQILRAWVARHVHFAGR